MGRRSLHAFLFSLIMTVFGSLSADSAKATLFAEKIVIGAVETFTIKECGIDFQARIDTGADLTSVHALNLEPLEKPTPLYKGKSVRAHLHNHRNEPCVVDTFVNRIIRVKSSHGTSIRYEIPLTLVFRNKEHQVFANLRNRSNLTYKLLVGRDFLEKGFIVDVTQ